MYTLQAGSELILHNVFNAKLISLDFVSFGVQGYLFSAVLLYQVYNFELINCSFQNSRSIALHALSSAMVLTGNSFTNNSAENPGGAILALHSHIYLQGTNKHRSTVIVNGFIASNVILVFVIVETACSMTMDEVR